MCHIFLLLPMLLVLFKREKMSLMKIITEEEMTYSGQSGVDGVKKSQ